MNEGNHEVHFSAASQNFSRKIIKYSFYDEIIYKNHAMQKSTAFIF